MPRRLEKPSSDEWPRWWEARGERELRCILMTAWDPLSVGAVPEAWDEYDGYAVEVARRLRDSTDSDQAAGRVAEYLDRVERDQMEMETAGHGLELRRLAESLVGWYEWSFRRGGLPPREWIGEG